MLLELAFVILLHLLLAPPALPDTHADEDTKGKKDQSPTSHHYCAQPPSPTEELCEAIGRPDEDKHNRGNHEPHRGSQAHHSQDSPESQLPGRQDKPIDFGADKMRQVRLQFPDLLL
jgi:hypothetical protein